MTQTGTIEESFSEKESQQFEQQQFINKNDQESNISKNDEEMIDDNNKTNDYGTSNYGDRLDYSQNVYRDRIWTLTYFINLATMLTLLS